MKALANLFAGRLGDRYGRKPILILGWLIGLPVPLIIILAPSWGWVVFANVLLGINQGFCWSTTAVIMKIDLVGPKQRGLAMGLNEFAGYLAASLSALMTGFLAAAHGFQSPVPFIPGLLFAALGLLFSLFFVQETRAHAHHEASLVRLGGHDDRDQPSFSTIFMRTSWQDKTLFAVCQAGLVNNLNDGMVWGLVPLLLAGFGVSVAQVALVAAAYPAVWGLGQLFTGALSDRWGRKWLIATGMQDLQAVGIISCRGGRTAAARRGGGRLAWQDAVRHT